MTKDEMLEAILDKFKAECDANNQNWSSAYARMTGALMVWVSEDGAKSLYNHYIGEAK